jgi:signal transduction histidine kinase
MVGSPEPLTRGAVDRWGEYSHRSRVERTISISRVVVIICCLFAYRIDPASAKTAPTVLAVSSVYFFYLLGMVAHVWTGHAPAPRWRLVDQALDAAMALLLLSLTGGTSGPFFSYLSFSLVFATLRWQWTGALAVGLPITVAFVGIGIAETLAGAPGVDSKTLVMQSGYLGALTGLLCCVGVYEQRVRRTILRVATWHLPSAVGSPHVEQLLRAAAGVLGAPRALLAWTERGEDSLHVASLTGGEVMGCDYEAWTVDTLVAEELVHVDFLSLDVTAAASTVTCLANGRLDRRKAGPALAVEVQHTFAMRSVIGVRLLGERVRGRLFLLDVPDATSDDLVMAALLARQVESRLEDRITARQVGATAAAEERAQLARDVHDGVLQSLAGIRLQLEAARRLIIARPDEAENVLLEVQDVVAAEQRGLRRMVSFLQRVEPDDAELGNDVADRITALVLRIERQWNVRVVVLTPIVHDDFDAVIPIGLGTEVYQILREAMINAARHARAQTVTVGVGVDGHAVRMTIADDGEGFPFTGRYDLSRLVRLDMGPTVLRQRVAALGGALTIESSRHGSRLEISIPLEPPPRLSVLAALIDR